MLYKTCNRCGETKNITDFSVKAGASDGYRNACKKCRNVTIKLAADKRRSDPDKRAAEIAARKSNYDNRSDEKKSEQREKDAKRFREKQDIVNKAFFDKYGCTKQELKYRLDSKVFIARSLARNGNKYSYDNFVYKGVNVKSEIFCNKHNIFFEQTPKSHDRGSGCKLCANEATGNSLRRSQEDFIKVAEELFGDKYTFENVEYINNVTPVDVTCRQHGSFMIRPGNLMTGRGCPCCAQYGYRQSLPGYLYVLKNDNITKVGITNRTPEDRIKDIDKTYIGFSVVHCHYCEDGRIPKKVETRLLSELRKVYKGVTEKFDGSTECFYDVDREQLLIRIEELINDN